MSKFELEAPLTSCEITQELLGRLEHYLLTEFSKITNIDSEDRDYSISITDDLGTEEFKSIKDFPLPLFPDHTEEISISLNPRKTPGISIKFSLERDSSRIRITYEGENAREIGISAYKGIERHLEPQKTNNRLYNFYPVNFIIGLLVVGPISGWLLSALTSKDLNLSSNLVITLLIIFMTSILYLTVGAKVHPYTLFDSNRARNYKKWSGWFLKGILGFVIFDLVLAYILKAWT